MDIEKTLTDAVDAGDLPGVAAAAATDKGVIFEGGAGLLRPDSVIWIASMTKAVTGAAAMQLVERGKLALDGAASDIVPELATKGVLEGFDASGKPIARKPRRPITLRHLLTHTSGLGYDTWNADVMKYRQATGIPAIGSCQNVALGTPLLDRYMTEKLFMPLGMTDTGFAIGPAQRPRKARMHTRGPNGITAVDHEIPQTPEFHMGGGGLYSTVSDYLKFTQALLAGGGPILKPETVRLMSENSMEEGVLCRPLKSQLPAMSSDLDFVDGMKWGLSFMINPTDFPGRRAAGSLAWGGLANSYYWIDPVRKVTGVWATQLLPFYDPKAVAAFESFERAVYSAL